MADPEVTVDGDVVNGFIVQVNDGERVHIFADHAANAEDAKATALKQYHEEMPVDHGAPDLSADIAHAHTRISMLEGWFAHLESRLAEAFGHPFSTSVEEHPDVLTKAEVPDEMPHEPEHDMPEENLVLQPRPHREA